MPWSRSDAIAFASFIAACIGIIVSVIGVGAGIFNPEIRERIFARDPRSQAAAPASDDDAQRAADLARTQAEADAALKRSQERLRKGANP